MGNPPQSPLVRGEAFKHCLYALEAVAGPLNFPLAGETLLSLPCQGEVWRGWFNDD